MKSNSLRNEASVFENASVSVAVGEDMKAGGAKAVIDPAMSTLSGTREVAERRAGKPRGVLYSMEQVRRWDESRLGYRFAKRAFDIAFSLCVLAVALVPGAILALAIRLETPGSPFYGQERCGRLGADGKPRNFRIWKFRSMVKDADKKLEALLSQNEVEGPMFKMENDPRVTRIGRFIRKHSIDEFPQFFNVVFSQ